MEENAESPPGGKIDPFAQPAGSPEAVQQSRDGARVVAAITRLPFESVDLFDDLDRNEDMIFLKAKQGMRIVEQDIGVQDVVFYQGIADASV
jgi:hypothetical protein